MLLIELWPCSLAIDATSNQSAVAALPPGCSQQAHLSPEVNLPRFQIESTAFVHKIYSLAINALALAVLYHFPAQ